jgi:hypothetical protein
MVTGTPTGVVTGAVAGVVIGTPTDMDDRRGDWRGELVGRRGPGHRAAVYAGQGVTSRRHRRFEATQWCHGNHGS